MARKANPELDSDRDLEHELQVARYLAVAFIAQSHGIGDSPTARKYDLRALPIFTERRFTGGIRLDAAIRSARGRSSSVRVA